MVFIRGIRSKQVRHVDRVRAEILSDAFSSLYAGSSFVRVEDPLCAKLVADEIDRQKKRVTEINNEFKRLDPRGFQKRASLLGRDRGVDVGLFELRREVADELHLPLSLYDYSLGHSGLEVSATRPPGISVSSDLGFAAHREAGVATLRKIFGTPETGLPRSARLRLSRSEALHRLLSPFDQPFSSGPAFGLGPDKKPGKKTPRGLSSGKFIQRIRMPRAGKKNSLQFFLGT